LLIVRHVHSTTKLDVRHTAQEPTMSSNDTAADLHRVERDRMEKDQENVRAVVRSGYSAIARELEPGVAAGSCCAPQGGCGVQMDASALAREIGYAPEEVALLPEGANMGLSCGNPAHDAVEKLTVPLYPVWPVMVRVVVPLPPGLEMDIDGGTAAIEKSDCTSTTAAAEVEPA
jgi:hypothetical protein